MSLSQYQPAERENTTNGLRQTASSHGTVRFTRNRTWLVAGGALLARAAGTEALILPTTSNLSETSLEIKPRIVVRFACVPTRILAVAAVPEAGLVGVGPSNVSSEAVLEDGANHGEPGIRGRRDAAAGADAAAVAEEAVRAAEERRAGDLRVDPDAPAAWRWRWSWGCSGR